MPQFCGNMKTYFKKTQICVKVKIYLKMSQNRDKISFYFIMTQKPISSFSQTPVYTHPDIPPPSF